MRSVKAYTFTVVVALLAVTVLAIAVATAWQYVNERREAERRSELWVKEWERLTGPGDREQRFHNQDRLILAATSKPSADSDLPVRHLGGEVQVTLDPLGRHVPGDVVSDAHHVSTGYPRRLNHA